MPLITTMLSKLCLSTFHTSISLFRRLCLYPPFNFAKSNNKAIQKRVYHVAEQAAAHDAHTAPSNKCKANHNNTNQNIPPVVVTQKECCLTTHQANQERTQKMIKKQQFVKVFMCATTVYAQQKEVDDRMSAASVSDMYNCEFKVNISPRLLQCYVQQERIGEALSQHRPSLAQLSPDTFKVLIADFELYLQLNQLNQETDKSKLSSLVPTLQLVLNPLGIPSCGIVQTLLNHVIIDTNCKVSIRIED